MTQVYLEKDYESLGEINRKPERFRCYLITHEHADHIHSMSVLARKYGMDLYANEKTWQAMKASKYLRKVDSSQKHILRWEKLNIRSDVAFHMKVSELAMMQLLHSFTAL